VLCRASQVPLLPFRSFCLHHERIFSPCAQCRCVGDRLAYSTLLRNQGSCPFFLPAHNTSSFHCRLRSIYLLIFGARRGASFGACSFEGEGRRLAIAPLCRRFDQREAVWSDPSQSLACSFFLHCGLGVEEAPLKKHHQKIAVASHTVTATVASAMLLDYYAADPIPSSALLAIRSNSRPFWLASVVAGKLSHKQGVARTHCTWLSVIMSCISLAASCCTNWCTAQQA